MIGMKITENVFSISRNGIRSKLSLRSGLVQAVCFFEFPIVWRLNVANRCGIPDTSEVKLDCRPGSLVLMRGPLCIALVVASWSTGTDSIVGTSCHHSACIVV